MELMEAPGPALCSTRPKHRAPKHAASAACVQPDSIQSPPGLRRAGLGLVGIPHRCDLECGGRKLGLEAATGAVDPARAVENGNEQLLGPHARPRKTKGSD